MIYRCMLIFYFVLGNYLCGNIYAVENEKNALISLYKKIDHYADVNDSIAVEYIYRYIEIADRINEKKHLSGAYRRLGIYYHNKENYSKALLNHNKALEVDLEREDVFAITSDYCNIGETYYKRKEFDNAIMLYQKTLDYYDIYEKNFPYGKGNVNGLVADVCLEQNKLENARKYCDKSIKYLLRTDNTDQEFNKLEYRIPRITDMYILDVKLRLKLKELDAVKNSLDSVKVYIELGSLKNQERDYNYLKALYDFEVNGKCCENINQVLTELKAEGLNERILDYYFLLKKQAVKQSQLSLALAYSDSIKHYQTKIHKKEKAKVLNEYLAEFETSKAKYETKEAILEKENANQKALIFTGLFMVALIFLILIFINLETRKKSHKKTISLKDLKIDELLRKNELENLQGLLAGQEVERKRIAQDLHDTIGGMLATIKLYFNALRKSKDLKGDNAEIFTNADNLLDESCKEVRRVSHDLNTGSASTYGLKENLKTLKNALELTSEVKVNVIADQFDLPISSPIEDELFKVIQELLSNTLKHAKATEINIQLSQFDNEIQLIFEDNGIGFNVNKIKRGLGLDSIKKRIVKLQGTLTIDSHERSGTTFIFEIPVKS